MSTGYQKQIEDKNRAARPAAEFVVGDVVKLANGARGLIVREGVWRSGAWRYQVRIAATPRGGAPAWNKHPVTLKQSKILRKLLPAEYTNLPPVTAGGTT